MSDNQVSSLDLRQPLVKLELLVAFLISIILHVTSARHGLETSAWLRPAHFEDHPFHKRGFGAFRLFSVFSPCRRQRPSPFHKIPAPVHDSSPISFRDKILVWLLWMTQTLNTSTPLLALKLMCCFQNWILQQHQDLGELVNALSLNCKVPDDELKPLVEKSIKHFEEYHGRRALMAQHYAPSFFYPTWCTSFETAFFWIGGCRPSLAFRLVYSVCGTELSGQLSEILRGERKGNLADISAHQMEMINTLHCKTVREEDMMSTRMEEIADEPLAMLATSAGRVGEWSKELVRAMDAHSLSLASILADADKLRISTLKELMAILTPFQGVDLLISIKKLHLSMHEWGKTKELQLRKPAAP
ncbi:protein DOG1-like 1 isoform X2 [Sesamum indicum]|uniref:Protein DOG1-like 1 isoform X2 n=1 Tax=Sesamum indicum TaxID=4182 RepID=A0A6I9TDN2_SESIN|nr:protein DOG1-like 1 isoform X2 [Sesamum indicum]